MSHYTLKDLEAAIDQLIDRLKMLESENITLREQLSTLPKEKETLIAKNKLAKEKVRHILDRLKALEKEI